MNKINLLLPINGLGERFKSVGYLTPKPLIKIFDKEMIFYLLDNLSLKNINKIYIPYNICLDDFNFKKILLDRYGDIFKFITIDKSTRGAAETINISLEYISEQDKKLNFIIMDCDTFYYEDVLQTYLNCKNKNCIFYFVENNNLDIFSFIEIKNNSVINIKEKEKISNYANCGIFCFEDFFILEKYTKKLLDSKETQKNEFYISGIYKFMIYDIIPITPLKVENFRCVGTPEQLKYFIMEKK